MTPSLTELVRSRITTGAGRMGAKVVGFAALAVAAVFLLGALFVWMARTESLVFACLVFAAGFVAIAAAGFIVSAVFERRERELKRSHSAFTAALANPTTAIAGLGIARTMARMPMVTLGLALAAGWLIVVLNQHKAGR